MDKIRANIALWLTPGLVSFILLVGGSMVQDLKSDIHRISDQQVTTNASLVAMSIRLERIDTQITERSATQASTTERINAKLAKLEESLNQIQAKQGQYDKRIDRIEAALQ